MNTSFYTAIGGIKSQQFGIDVWGNNIANINTKGFKYSEPEFASLMSQSMSSAAIEGFGDIGLGSRAQSAAISTKQGSLISTDNVFDVALSGKGYFGVQGPEGKTYYTRNGAFSVDNDGYLVNTNGYYVLGQTSSSFSVDKTNSGRVELDMAKISIGDPKKQSPIQVPKYITHPGIPAVPAEKVETIPFNFSTKKAGTVPTESDNYGTDLPITPIDIPYFLTTDSVPTLTIKDTAGNTIATVEIPAEVRGEHVYTWDGRIEIPREDSDGNPMYDSSGKQMTTPGFVPAGDYVATLEYVSKPAVATIGKGDLESYQVDTNGNVVARFTNGLNSVISQIPLFQFSNEQGLNKNGEDLYEESANSGQMMFYKDSKGAYVAGAQIQSHVLEGSNVSLSDAMTALIITQKAFDANSKCITTSDQMIQKALALKNR